MKKLIILLSMLVAYSIAGTMTDSRDGKTYRTVKIGKQTWMAENLNYKTNDSYCYNNNEGMCKKYGRLYTWYAAKKACPSGWHLPSNDEWNTLLTAVGFGTAGTKLKSKSGWNSNGNGSDSFGFAVLPAGYRDYDGDFFEGSNAYFWSSTELNSNRAYSWNFNYSTDYAYEGNGNKNLGSSVRCLRNSNEEREASLARPSEAGAATEQNQGRIKDPRDGKTYKTVKIGKQTWMAENLNYKTSDSYCYNNNEGMCKKYGRLYKWNAAKSACPSGWHLPSNDEWNTLWTAVGGTGTAGTKLKSKSGWYNNGNGTDSFGFAVLPAGFRNDNGNFYFEGKGADFWSSSEYSWGFYNFGDDVSRDDISKNGGFSVRCLQDSNEEREASLARPSEAGAATEQNQGRIKDPRDGKTYRTVKIGSQTWMAENLNYDPGNVSSMGSYAWSGCYNNEPSNCTKYGRLYTWEVAMNNASCAYGKNCNASRNPTTPVRGVCPSGWHLPSHREFEELINHIDPSFEYNHTGDAGSSRTAGEYLKSKSGWNSNGNGTDAYGFSALPGGYRLYTDYFRDAGHGANFWSSSEYSSYCALYLDLYYKFEYADLRYYNKGNAGSVRCLRDSN